MMRWPALAVLLAVWTQTGPEPLTVSAAISLTDALEAIAKVYAERGGSPVRFNFAGSNVLARQLVNGAPADLFISADAAQMAGAAEAGAVARGRRVDLLGNRLAVIVRRGASGPPIRQLQDLLRPDVKRIALGDPSAVPAGVYAREYLKAAGVWTELE